jgi:hypothetical protein
MDLTMFNYPLFCSDGIIGLILTATMIFICSFVGGPKLITILGGLFLAVRYNLLGLMLLL